MKNSKNKDCVGDAEIVFELFQGSKPMMWSNWDKEKLKNIRKRIVQLKKKDPYDRYQNDQV